MQSSHWLVHVRRGRPCMAEHSGQQAVQAVHGCAGSAWLCMRACTHVMLARQQSLAQRADDAAEHALATYFADHFWLIASTS